MSLFLEENQGGLFKVVFQREYHPHYVTACRKKSNILRYDSRFKIWYCVIGSDYLANSFSEDFKEVLSFFPDFEVKTLLSKISNVKSHRETHTKESFGKLESIKKDFRLFDHQYSGIKWILEKKNALLCDDMGLGKTRQAIAWAILNGSKNVLVICPATLKNNWKKEIELLSGTSPEKLDSFVIPTDTEKFYSQKENTGINFLIINYDIIKKASHLIMMRKWDSLIADEIHYCKNSTAARSKALIAISETIPQVLGLTGTPLTNNPKDLINPLKCIKSPLVANSWKFIERYCNPVKIRLKTGRTFFKYGAKNLHELHEKLSGFMLRRIKEETLNLPEKITTVNDLEMSASDMKEYKEQFKRYIEAIRQVDPNPKKITGIELAKALVEIGLLKQYCSNLKINTVKKRIRDTIDQGQKCVIFSQYDNPLQEIFEEFKDNGAVLLTGKTQVDDRQNLVDKFQTDPECKVFVANIKAGGVGITLTAAQIVYFMDLPWTPTDLDQAESRCHRIGTTGTVNIHYFIYPDTIEEDIWKLLKSKQKIINETIEGKIEEIETQTSIGRQLIEKTIQRST